MQQTIKTLIRNDTLKWLRYPKEFENVQKYYDTTMRNWYLSIVCGCHKSLVCA